MLTHLISIVPLLVPSQTPNEPARAASPAGQVAITFDESHGRFTATWSGKAHAAVRGTGFVVEAGEAKLRPDGIAPIVGAFRDKLGSGKEFRQAWGDPIRVERIVRVYDDRPAVTVSGRITNAGTRDLSLGTTRLMEVSEGEKGAWTVGGAAQSPAAMWIGGISELLCQPAAAAEQVYSGTGILALYGREPATMLTVGYLTANEARPDLHARFRPATGGISLTAELRFLGRLLGPGKSIDLDTVYLAAYDDPYLALESYADAVAAVSRRPARPKTLSLWCSWYAHRMAMTEDLVLANAAVAARHFKPLGMDIIQLDHGWQVGDITGDWQPNERFPHGLKWLADELRSRHGMRLGVWIAPTDVAETSETFKAHADWMLKGDNGKPLVNWKWYWKPNPNCYELDATHPDAYRWMTETFARLSAAGVSYYKIDFIAASAGEHFRQHDPKATRGWSALCRSMEAVRVGAGPDALIRYCQVPPLLAIGLADGAYGGADTLDAGLNGNIDVLRTNARSLAAGYWIQDRLYHREVCDMSVRMQADVEEVRMRLAMMALAGCSISFSDELQYLPPSRIRMMQQCLPPGVPPMRPLDLFDRTIPSVWAVRCRNAAEEWHVIGLFNFENKPEERSVDFAAIGLPPDADALVFEFWEGRLLGTHRKGLTLTLPPQTSRVLSVRRATGRPQVVGTDMHIAQGHHEITRLAWDDAARTLAGECRRAPGLTGRVFIHVPAGWQPHFDFPLAKTSARLTNIGGGLWAKELVFDSDRVEWSVPFDAAK